MVMDHNQLSDDHYFHTAAQTIFTAKISKRDRDSFQRKAHNR